MTMAERIENQLEYAAFILRELVAEANNGHVRETTAVVLARQWVEIQDEFLPDFTTLTGGRGR